MSCFYSRLRVLRCTAPWSLEDLSCGLQGSNFKNHQESIGPKNDKRHKSTNTNNIPTILTIINNHQSSQTKLNHKSQSALDSTRSNSHNFEEALQVQHFENTFRTFHPIVPDELHPGGWSDKTRFCEQSAISPEKAWVQDLNYTYSIFIKRDQTSGWSQ